MQNNGLVRLAFDNTEDAAWEMNSFIDALLAVGIPAEDIYVGGSYLVEQHLPVAA